MPLSDLFPRRSRSIQRAPRSSFSDSLESLEQRVHLAATLPLVVLSIADASASERDTNMGRFTLTRFGDLSAPLSVNFTIAGSAIPGADYLGLSNSAIIPAGRNSVSIPIIPFDDLAVEGPENVRLIITRNDTVYRRDESNPLNRNLSITIADNDFLPLVTLAAPDNFAAEGGGSAGIDTATFAVRRTGATDLPLTVRYRVGGSATPGSDYEALGNSITIPIGRRAAFITIRAHTDALFEGRETVRVTLLTTDSSLYSLSQTEPNRVSLAAFISDRPLVTLVVTDPVATGHPSDTAEFTLSRTGPTAAPLQVSYVLGGSAQSGVDFVALPTVLTIPANRLFVRIRITGTGAQPSQNAVTLRITLTQLPGYNLNFADVSTFTSYITVIDDSVPPGV